MKEVFKISTDPGSLGNKFRQKRMGFFRELLAQLPKPVQILDIGGNEAFWVNAGFQNNADVHITILNLKPQQTINQNMKFVVGDATNLSQYSNNAFDLVFSNSVIEHLYTKSNQEKMAHEVRRVGMYYFVQTPNKYFIIEPHYLLPWFQFMPKSLRYSILTNTKLSRMRKWDKEFAQQYLDEIRLLSKNEMQQMFPDGKIWKEDFFGLAKSFTAHNFTTEDN